MKYIAGYRSIIEDWKDDFTSRIRSVSQKGKGSFTFKDAVNSLENYTNSYDKSFLIYHRFIEGNPLRHNDYYKYVDSYINGKELNIKFFRHDIDKLKRYYKNADEAGYDPFNMESYKRYVLFMILKLNGHYKEEFNPLFNVKKQGHREYNPLTGIPSVLRGELPIEVKEYDIKRAYPTFIDSQLGIERINDVYDIIDKKKFNTLINTHSGVGGGSIEAIRRELKVVYGERVDEVITEERFNTKGGVFRDLVSLEENAIKGFVENNGLKNYARLHDGVFVLKNVECSNLNIDGVQFAIKECIKPVVLNEKENFYKFNSEGKLQTSPKQYADFLSDENFIRVTEKDNDKVTIFKDSNNVVAPFNHRTDTVPFFKENINENYVDEVENRIAREVNTAINQAFFLMDPKPLKYYSDTRDCFGLPFKNGFYKYTKGAEALERLEYSAVDGFFPPHDIQGRIFDYKESDPGMFEQFLIMASTGKDPRKYDLSEKEVMDFDAFCCMIGYLCHSYKRFSFSPAIILSDTGANDLNRMGGRGKTIIARAIGHAQKTMLKGGDEFKPSYIHNFADLTKDVNVYVIDDVPAGFNYDALYTNILGDISCQRKGTAAQTISFIEAPKFLITTNWAVRYDETNVSTNRRFIEFKLTDFFNMKNKVDELFGCTFFEEWDKREWDKFYSFIFSCVGLYLEFGITPINYDKDEDNFLANFNGDSVLDEFERIFEKVKLEDFTVKRFLEIYQAYDNPMKVEKYFHKNNVKKMINIYIKHKKLPFEYVQRERKWKCLDVEPTDF
ncbi:hypothetical protein [uncultured Eudoraea sp.]|uniref:hypothetical protein n=1 Tax=uncultured Eudoraea sp. TaxID=1035614 RepID=UPI002601CB5C|nr:hypothetical protein [uncultured Eudoraea sp.]